MTPPAPIGTYTPPTVRKGDRVFCLYRDCECVVSSWTDSRISWPRVGVRGQQGGSGLWIDETLLRAIRTESATALKYWFGIGTFAVWRWRKAFGVGRTGTVSVRRRC